MEYLIRKSENGKEGYSMGLAPIEAKKREKIPIQANSNNSVVTLETWIHFLLIIFLNLKG